jgi:hypothetical protein
VLRKFLGEQLGEFADAVISAERAAIDQNDDVLGDVASEVPCQDVPEPSTVLALSLALITAAYIGFAVADGRPMVIAVECAVAGVFVVLAATAVTATAWILVLAFTSHGLKDAWQERSHCVADTRWWPPFCAAVDWLVAGVLMVEIAAGVRFH